MGTAPRWLALVAAGAVVLAACGGSGELSLEQQEVMDRSGWTRDLPDDQRSCVQRGLRAKRLDPARVIVDPDALEDRRSVMDVLVACVPAPAEVPSLVQLVTSIWTGTPVIPPAEGQCFVRRIVAGSDDPARTLSALDGPQDAELTREAAEWCFSGSTRDALAAAGPADPTAYGDDPWLDGLHDRCVADDDRACDLLSLVAPPGSGYAVTAGSCGGRGLAPAVTCSPDLVLDAHGVAPEDSRGTLRIRSDCALGDMLACDLLYWSSPAGSDHEEFGFTCGGRNPTGRGISCDRSTP